MDFSFARRDIERLYTDTCSVIEYQGIVDPETHITSSQEVTVLENVPCRVSHKYNTLAPAGTGDAATVELISKLMLSPDVYVKTGSKVIVTRAGVTTAYKCSGEAARYITHQEIVLKTLEGYA